MHRLLSGGGTCEVAHVCMSNCSVRRVSDIFDYLLSSLHYSKFMKRISCKISSSHINNGINLSQRHRALAIATERLDAEMVRSLLRGLKLGRLFVKEEITQLVIIQHSVIACVFVSQQERKISGIQSRKSFDHC